LEAELLYGVLDRLAEKVRHLSVYNKPLCAIRPHRQHQLVRQVAEWRDADAYRLGHSALLILLISHRVRLVVVVANPALAGSTISRIKMG
jgi:hypothetical protein